MIDVIKIAAGILAAIGIFMLVTAIVDEVRHRWRDFRKGLRRD